MPRLRNVRREIKLTEEENTLVLEKMLCIPTNNFNAYARKMLIDGYIIKHDFKELKSLTAHLGKIGSNINQIAKRANETRVVHDEDIKEVLIMLHKIKLLVNDEIGKLIK